MQRSHHYYEAGLVFLVAWLFRLVPWLAGLSNPARFLAPDSSEYLELSRRLATVGEYGAAGAAELFRVPGYPFFLASLHRLGVRDPVWIGLAQGLLGAWSCVVLYAFCRRLLAAGGAASANGGLRFAPLCAGLLLAVSDLAAATASLVLSETLFTFLLLGLLLGCECLAAVPGGGRRPPSDLRPVAVLPRSRSLACAGLGLLAGIASLTRVIFLPVLPVFAIYLWWRGGGWRTALLFLGAALLLPALWSVRNHARADYFGVSTVGAINLYRYNAAALTASQSERSFAEVQEEFTQRLAAAPDQRARAEWASRRGREIVLSAPVKYLGLHLRSSMNSLLPGFGDLARLFGAEIGGRGTLAVINGEGIIAGIRHYFNGQWGWLAAALPFVALLLAVYAGALGGWLWLIRGGRMVWSIPLFHLTVLLWFLVSPGPAAHPRFRVVAEPLFCLYAAVGLALATDKVRSAFSKKERLT